VSKTSAGQTASKEHKEALGATFELFRISYGNQFNAAYPDLERSTAAMRLWLTHLQDYPAALIKAAAERVVKHENFLPTVAKFREHCDHAFELFGLPDAHSAYMEACRAPQPKSEYRWSHVAVYYAGLASDWFFMANSIESKALPVFKRNYAILCERVIRGEDLKMPVRKALPAELSAPLSATQNKKKLSALRKQLDL
jgi:hypothetical protein